MADQRRKLWVGVGAFVLLSGQAADAVQSSSVGQPETEASPSVMLASSDGGEGGEASHGGEGGEASAGGEGGEGGEASHGGEGGEASAGGEGGEGGEGSSGLTPAQSVFAGGEGGEGGEAGGEGGEAGHGGEGGEAGGEGGEAGGEGGEAGGEGGEASAGGEGGEGGEGGGGSVSATDSAGYYYSQLGYMLGHLNAARALYEAGDAEAAHAHLAHPAVEHLPIVREALEQRGLSDVSNRIYALANAAGNEPSWPDVSSDYEATRQAIEHAMNDVSADERQSAAFQAKVLTAIVLQARHEYEEAIEGGRIAHPHEYRDSWGFMQVGRQLLDDNASVFRQADAGNYQQLVERYEAVMGAWPSVEIPQNPTSVSRLYGLVSSFEFVASRFDESGEGEGEGGEGGEAGHGGEGGEAGHGGEGGEAGGEGGEGSHS